MTTETLSDKIHYCCYGGYNCCKTEDVKDFIQKLKEEMMKMANHNPDSHPDKSCFHCAIWKKIDKLAGDALIHSPEEKSKRKSFFSSKSSGTHSPQKPILETMAEQGRPSKGSHHGTDAKDVGSEDTHGERLNQSEVESMKSCVKCGRTKAQHPSHPLDTKSCAIFIGSDKGKSK